MNIVDIIKSTKDFQMLCEEIKKQNISKSILLYSKDKFYADMFSKMLAILLLNDGEFCENENYVKVMANSHPDVKTYPQKDKLLVADSEEIVMESYIKPIFSDKKIFIIRNIDNSMESAQNKLLKVLEEPPQNVYFIITCFNPNLLLPTIKSRCNKIELAKIDKNLIMEAIKDNDNKSLITAISDGHLGRAIELAKNNEINQIFELALSIVTKMKSSKMVLSFSNKINNFKDDLTLLIEIFCMILEDMLFIKTVRYDYLKFKEYRKDLEEVIDEYSVKAICEIQNNVNKALKEISYNGNIVLIIENLLLNILEVKYICR